MEIKTDYDLTTLNTFGVNARADFFVELTEESEIPELLNSEVFKNNERLFLGGGSNILFTKDWGGLVILNKLKGIEIVSEDVDTVLIKALSGVVWHDLVLFAVDKGYWGIENLSLIPGTVGGAPMQNIGAYGVELAHTLHSIEVYDLTTGEKKTLSKEESKPGYRDSAFKNELKGKYFISAVILNLSKIPNKNISYKVLSDHLSENNIEPTHPKHISDAVSDIRRSKLPDPKVIGNAGSFFKNIILDKETGEDKLNELLKIYPDMPHFEEDASIKIPAGWLIEQTGWKGKREGNVGVHEKQALVIVNHGGATGLEIKAFAEKIIASVEQKFGLVLVPEVNLI